MRRTLLFVLGGLMLAGIIHIATVTTVPYFAVNDAWAEMRRFVPQLNLTSLTPRQIRFAPDDDTLLLVVNDTGRIDVVDLSNSCEPVKITEIETDALDASFSPRETPRDKLRIISGGLDGMVRLWNLVMGKQEAVFEGHGGPVTAVGYSPDGQYAVSGAMDATVRMWRLPR